MAASGREAVRPTSAAYSEIFRVGSGSREADERGLLRNFPRRVWGGGVWSVWGGGWDAPTTMLRMVPLPRGRGRMVGERRVLGGEGVTLIPGPSPLKGEGGSG